MTCPCAFLFQLVQGNETGTIVPYSGLSVQLSSDVFNLCQSIVLFFLECDGAVKKGALLAEADAGVFEKEIVSAVWNFERLHLLSISGESIQDSSIFQGEKKKRRENEIYSREAGHST